MARCLICNHSPECGCICILERPSPVYTQHKRTLPQFTYHPAGWRVECTLRFAEQVAQQLLDANRGGHKLTEDVAQWAESIVEKAREIRDSE